MSLAVSLRHQFGPVDLDITFEAPKGVTVLFGRSGSGKTTIVNTVAGLFKPDQSRVSLNGTLLGETPSGLFQPPHKRRLGYVFQDARLFPHLSVRTNLAYGQWFAGKRLPKAEQDKLVDMLGLGPLLDRRTTMLSGGERQRVALGRALMASPQMVLADEPLAALDAQRKAEILPYFERLRDEAEVPILYVTHAAAEVARLATSVVVLDDGKVVRQGPAVEVLADPMVTPTGARAAGAVMETRIAKHHDDGLTELNAGGVPLYLPRVTGKVGDPLRVRIAASEVILSRQRPEGLSALNILPGVIDQLRSGDGPGAIASLTTPAGPLLARITLRSAQALGITPGADCFAVVKTVSIAPEDVGG